MPSEYPDQGQEGGDPHDNWDPANMGGAPICLAALLLVRVTLQQADEESHGNLGFSSIRWAPSTRG